MGLVYFLLRDYFFWDIYSHRDNKSTIVILYIWNSIPGLVHFIRKIPHDRSFMNVVITEKQRVALLSVVLKFFYIPIMLSFLVGNISALWNLWVSPPVGLSGIILFTNWVYFLLFNAIFLLDTVIFSFGYLIEAKWLGNEIKSVDPYLSGWVFALICYPPFNSVIDQIIPAYQQPYTFFSLPFLFIFQLITIGLYIVYVWASVALLWKASNLTNRGIISHGPYGFIRHPAYAAKNLAWWFEKIPYMTSWVGVVSVLTWNIIYIMRALTEERHLIKDPDYQEYTKTVTYRFIPGVI